MGGFLCSPALDAAAGIGAVCLGADGRHRIRNTARNLATIRLKVGTEVRLTLVPMTLAEANEFVRQHHRHHRPVPGAKFCTAVASSEDGIWHVLGVAIAGRPVARMADDGWTLEVNRTCVSEAPNANSMLYGACARAAFAMGYKRLVTYTLPEEGGTSLRAAGWREIGRAGGGPWSRANRPRVDLHPLQEKIRWEALAVEHGQAAWRGWTEPQEVRTGIERVEAGEL